ncbi:hypothetical protein Cpir12675_005430 [Ceratocystis pirilliformis]|uniref:Very-long-chain 3-oxoacyl-CoA reductase n=1 Tax=Ceratocystis pirilliformis TaxID=259994 RepID=A0ABR3YR96_9PEZI
MSLLSLQDIPETVQLLLMGMGGALFLGKAFNILQFAFNVFLLSGTNLRKYGKPGTWAVVTGASDGLGKEFAMQLAAQGFNIVLVSRTKSKLDALAAELEEKYAAKGLKTKVVSMDYAEDKDEDYNNLAATVMGLDIGILINNVGQSHNMPVPFIESDKNELQNIVTVNCLGTLKTTQIVAPIMVQRRKGLILTMGSFSGWIPTPYLATYAGSKAFLQHWSESLAGELKADGIDVQLVLSYLVTTAMSKVRRTSAFIPNPRSFVKSALSKIGLGSFQRNSNTITPWWGHALMLWVVENTVTVNNTAAIDYNLDMHKDIRKRALKKAAREAKDQ